MNAKELVSAIENGKYTAVFDYQHLLIRHERKGKHKFRYFVVVDFLVVYFEQIELHRSLFGAKAHNTVSIKILEVILFAVYEVCA